MNSLLFLLVLSAATDLPDTPQRDFRVVAVTYLTHVLRYQSGDHTGVVHELARWSADELRLALRGIPAALVSMQDQLEEKRISSSTVVANAMLVHVEIAMQTDIAAEIDRHLSIGDRLSDLLPSHAMGREFTARWHLMAGTIMLSLSRPVEAFRRFEMARQFRPRDPAILVALGSVLELQGSQWAQRIATDEPLKEASRLYRLALEVAPNLSEARIRLARTQHLVGNLDAASMAIAVLQQGTLDTYTRYLTLLIGGSIAEEARRSDQALAEYRQARALCGGCQSATLALTQLLVRMGNRSAARDLVENLLQNTTWPPPGDPWWMYQQGQWHSAHHLLEQIRREVPK